MQILDPSFDLDRFFAQLAEAPRPVLLLDYDGTLAPFHIDPALAFPYPGVRPLLERIMSGRSRLVVISGRWTRDLLPLLGLAHPPEIWGSHGFERRFADGRQETAQPETRALKTLADADAWAEGLKELGARLEHKPASLAVHWRGLPETRVQEIASRVHEHWSEALRASGLELHGFDGGLELRAPGRNKGYAVKVLLDELHGEATVAFLGDDLTDEDALRAIREHGLGVLVRPELRPTAASVWLCPPEELLAFLTRWAEATAH